MLYVTHHPVAMVYDSNRDKHGIISNEVGSISEAELLYVLTKPNHKLEKMLELKVVMNQLESQMGIYSEAKLLRGQQQRLEYVTGKFRELQQYHPMFYHCNKDLIMNCLVALIRNIKLELWNYDDLYDQFY